MFIVDPVQLLLAVLTLAVLFAILVGSLIHFVVRGLSKIVKRNFHFN